MKFRLIVMSCFLMLGFVVEGTNDRVYCYTKPISTRRQRSIDVYCPDDAEEKNVYCCQMQTSGRFCCKYSTFSLDNLIETTDAFTKMTDFTRTSDSSSVEDMNHYSTSTMASDSTESTSNESTPSSTSDTTPSSTLDSTTWLRRQWTPSGSYWSGSFYTYTSSTTRRTPRTADERLPRPRLGTFERVMYMTNYSKVPVMVLSSLGFILFIMLVILAVQWRKTRTLSSQLLRPSTSNVNNFPPNFMSHYGPFSSAGTNSTNFPAPRKIQSQIDILPQYSSNENGIPQPKPRTVYSAEESNHSDLIREPSASGSTVSDFGMIPDSAYSVPDNGEVKYTESNQENAEPSAPDFSLIYPTLGAHGNNDISDNK